MARIICGWLFDDLRGTRHQSVVEEDSGGHVYVCNAFWTHHMTMIMVQVGHAASFFQWLLNDTDRTSNWWLNKSWLIYWIMTCTYNSRFPIATIVCYVPVKPPWLTSMATHRYPQRPSLRWWWPNPLLNYQKWPELCMNINSLMRFVLLEISWNSLFWSSQRCSRTIPEFGRMFHKRHIFAAPPPAWGVASPAEGHEVEQDYTRDDIDTCKLWGNDSVKM